MNRNFPIICAWCNKVLREGDPELPASHGICTKCSDDQRKHLGLPPADR